MKLGISLSFAALEEAPSVAHGHISKKGRVEDARGAVDDLDGARGDGGGHVVERAARDDERAGARVDAAAVARV